MTAAAFKACYSGWSLVKTRGAVQIIFEVPVDESDAAYQALGGMPIAAREVWCGIARLNKNTELPNLPAPETPGDSGSDQGKQACTADDRDSHGRHGPHSHSKPRPSIAPASAIGVDIKERRSFSALPYPQQAALRCNDPIFRAFLRECCSADAGDVRDAEQAKLAIYKICDIGSRADTKPGTEAEDYWLALEQWFASWQTADRVGLASDTLPRPDQPALASIGRGEN